MKELEKHRPERTEIHNIKPVKKELKYLGSLKPKRGQRVYELNLETKLIREAEYAIETIILGNTSNEFCKHRKLVIKNNCLYAVSINPENADKKFHKQLGIKYNKKRKA